MISWDGLGIMSAWIMTPNVGQNKGPQTVMGGWWVAVAERTRGLQLESRRKIRTTHRKKRTQTMPCNTIKYASSALELAFGALDAGQLFLVHFNRRATDRIDLSAGRSGRHTLGKLTHHGENGSTIGASSSGGI